MCWRLQASLGAGESLLAGWLSLEHGMCVPLPCALCRAVKTQFLFPCIGPKRFLLPPKGWVKLFRAPILHRTQGRRAERESLLLEVQAPGWCLLGGQCSPPSLCLAVPKTHNPHVQKHVSMNGNHLLFGRQGTNKQVETLC